MKRELKNQQTKKKIIDSALRVFSAHGYEGGSLNMICQSGAISKGIIYHYFESKDKLYLYCVEECFGRLIAYLRGRLEDQNETSEKEKLIKYFQARSGFFETYPLYARIFAEAIMMPPQSLMEEMNRIKASFHAFNGKYLTAMLENVPLRKDLSITEMVSTLHFLQDSLNAHFEACEREKLDLEKHEKQCQNVLEIFLYGIIRRER